MASLAPKEKGFNQPSTVETARLVVSQPHKLQELNLLLESFDALDRRISERVGEDRSQDMGTAGATATGSQQQGQGQQSARDLAIAAMPTEPEVLQHELSAHIQKEIRHLQRLASKASSSSQPGGAFRLNQLYARIRRLNALLKELIDASIEILRRFFTRVFIDKQSII